MARDRDPKALALVLDRVLIVAKRAAAKVLLKDPERVDIDQESQDLVQAFVLHVLEREWKILFDHKPELSPFDAYVFLVAWGYMLNLRKHGPWVHGIRPKGPQDMPEPAPGPDPSKFVAERQLAVRVFQEVLGKLSADQRELFVELMIEQRPVREIMERFGKQENAIFKQRERFRTAIEEAKRRLLRLRPDEPLD